MTNAMFGAPANLLPFRKPYKAPELRRKWWKLPWFFQKGRLMRVAVSKGVGLFWVPNPWLETACQRWRDLGVRYGDAMII